MLTILPSLVCPLLPTRRAKHGLLQRALGKLRTSARPQRLGVQALPVRASRVKPMPDLLALLVENSEAKSMPCVRLVFSHQQHVPFCSHQHGGHLKAAGAPVASVGALAAQLLREAVGVMPTTQAFWPRGAHATPLEPSLHQDVAIGQLAFAPTWLSTHERLPARVMPTPP